jgi:serine/threonine-protein kinase
MTQCTQCSANNRPAARYCSVCGAMMLSLPAGAASPLVVGTMVQARYKVLSLLGKGGMGAVYQVEDTRVFGKRWALKELLDILLPPADRAQAIQQFQSEAQMLVRMSHLNLPQIADYFSENGRQYLVMEYVDGETLEAVLGKTSGFLPEAQVYDWASQLCDVLACLHGQKPPVIFRDLKPDNIMLTRAGVIKLIDFGIARSFRPGKTKDTHIMGTPGFAAPEQYGGGQTDARSDIYSLGATLHRLLTRYNPSAQPFTFPRCKSLNSAVSAQFDSVVSKATERDPAQRFQTVTEMKQALLAVASIPYKSTPAWRVTPTTAGVIGPAPIQWLQTAPLNTFSAYCSIEQQETTWIHEYDGSCTCTECDTSHAVGDVAQVLKAPCNQCGAQTTWAISDEKCICLGCGQEWAITDVSGAIEVYCSQCKAKTPWVIGYTDDYRRVCLWCGQER